MPNVRIPLSGAYNTRFAESGVSASSSGVVGIGIVGVMVVGRTTAAADKDQRYINCYPITVKNDITQQVTPYLIKRPGFQASITPASGNAANDVHVWVGNANKLITSFGTTNSTIYDSTTSLGNITGACTGITETILSGTANLAFTSSDNTGWYYAASGTLTKISDGDFPGNASRTLAGTFAHMDGYAFVMDSTGRIYNSDVNSLTAWTANSFTTANLNPDSGVGCVKHRNHIIAFGAESYEVFYNAGNTAGSPLGRRDEASRKIGLVNAKSVCTIEDNLAFVGTSALGGLAVYVLDGFSPIRVSTPEIEAQLVLTTASNVSISACKWMGRTLIAVCIGSGTYVYCIEEKAWHEWSSQTPLWHRMSGSSSGVVYVTYAVSTASTLGKVYIVNPSNFVFQDDSVSYTASFQSSLIDNGNTDRKTMDELVVVADTTTSSSTLSISFSDDDYVTWSTPRTIDLSSDRKKLPRCGAFRRRSVKLSHSSNTSMRIQALDAKIRQGAN